MKIHKLIKPKENTAKNNFVFIYRISENKDIITQIKYTKELRDSVDSKDIEDFNIKGESLKMDYPENKTFYLAHTGVTEIKLNDISPRLQTVNANILYSISDVYDKGFYNRDIEASVNKLSAEENNLLSSRLVMFNVFKPFPDGEITDIVFNVHNVKDVIIDIEDIIEHDGEYPNLPKVNPLLKINNVIEQDTILEGSVQLVDKELKEVKKAGIEINIKSNCGQLSRSKVVTNSEGMGKFKLNSTMLDVGDEIVIKAGFKYFSNINNSVVKVI